MSVLKINFERKFSTYVLGKC